MRNVNIIILIINRLFLLVVVQLGTLDSDYIYNSISVHLHHLYPFRLPSP